MDHTRAPLLDAVQAAAARSHLRLHTPAHQGTVDPGFAALMGAAISADLTELDDTDDLRCPSGPIAEAQRLAADLWGADRTFFLVGGASAGNVAALLACTGTGGTRTSPAPIRRAFPGQAGDRQLQVVIGRNAHVSAIAGLVLAGCDPVWVPAPWDTKWGVARPPGARDFAAAVAEHPDVVAVFATTPSYYGEAADVAALRQVAGNLPLVVDEAHGAHVPRALAAGADLVVHSVHKGLAGPTGGGYLHVQGDRVDAKALAAALRLVQTTSPSYWILAGLDAARREAALMQSDIPFQGQEPDPQDPVSSLEALSRSTGLEIRPSDDPARVLVRFADGYRAYDALARRGLVAEAALPGAVLLLIGRGSMQRIEAIAEHLCAVAGLQGGSPPCVPPPPRLPRAQLSPRQAALGASEEVSLDRAEGRICSEAVCPYPPGIPVLVPGEAIDATALAHLRMVAPQLDSIRVAATGFSSPR